MQKFKNQWRHPQPSAILLSESTATIRKSPLLVVVVLYGMVDASAVDHLRAAWLGSVKEVITGALSLRIALAMFFRAKQATLILPPIGLVQEESDLLGDRRPQR